MVREAEPLGTGLGNQTGGLLTALPGSKDLCKGQAGESPVCAFPGPDFLAPADVPFK